MDVKTQFNSMFHSEIEFNQIFYANECNDCFTRCCCGFNRPFTMEVFDIYQREVMHFSRPCTYSGFCGSDHLDSLQVATPPGQIIGKIEENRNSPQFLVKNVFDETVLRIEGPFCSYPSAENIEFQVKTFCVDQNRRQDMQSFE